MQSELIKDIVPTPSPRCLSYSSLHLPTKFTSDIVTFNVGGKIYCTTRSTINHFPRSVLASMISDSNNLQSKCDEAGHYFIDRSIFRYILNYLRDKTLNLPDNFNEFKQLKYEADFYQIDSLITEIENRTNAINEQQKQNLDGLYFTLISKLNQDKILTIIGPIKVLRLFRLEQIARKFVKTLNPSISCQCNFPNKDKIISCQPWNEFQRQLLAKQARKFGLPTGYWDDYFYLP
ncbi:unnamed protein product, partial [Didymodactylos carnosus]